MIQEGVMGVVGEACTRVTGKQRVSALLTNHTEASPVAGTETGRWQVCLCTHSHTQASEAVQDLQTNEKKRIPEI